MRERDEVKLFGIIKQSILDRSFKEVKPGMQTLYRMNENDILFLADDIRIFIDKSYPHA